ncbi:MAG: glycosyltransferase family 39 protein [Candidatus Coatesbacteria bacterium]
MNRSGVRPIWLTALLAAFALLYAAWPSWDWYFDGLVFAGAVEGVGPGHGFGMLFHPHHLFYCPIAWVAYRATLAAGLVVRAWFVQQMLSVVCAVATLALFSRLARRTGIPAPLGLAGTVLLGVCYIFWHFASQGDTTMPSTLLQILIMERLAAYADRPRPGAAAALGLLLAAGFLVHQSAAVFVPAAVWVLLRTGEARARLRGAILCLGAAGAGVAGGYLAAGVWGLGMRHPAEMLAWLHGYVGVDPLTGYAQHYSRWALESFPISARALCEAFVGPAADGRPGRLVVAGLAIAVLGAVALRGLHARWAALPPARRAFLQGLGIALAAHAVFFTWWSVGHTRYWTSVLPGWILLFELGLTGLPGRQGPRRAAMLAWSVAGAVALAVAAGPARREISPSCNRFLPIADRLMTATTPDSLVIISGVGEYNALKAYVSYVARRYLMVLDWRFSDRTVPPAAAVVRLRTYLVLASRERPVYVLSEALAPSLDEHFAEALGVTPDLRRALFAPFRLRPAADLEPGLVLLRLEPRR